jgi:hypothetical protein
MKQLLFFLIIAIATPMFGGQAKHDPTQPKVKPEITGPKEPKISGLPAHHSSSIPAAKNAPKAGGVDAQLNELEKQNGKIVSGPATQKKSRPPASVASKSAPASSGTKAIDFKYQPPKSSGPKNSSKRGSTKVPGYRPGH